MLHIFVDADACPVKQEVCKVAKRYGLQVTFVSNCRMRIPDQEGATLTMVGNNPDEADDLIVEQVSKDDIVVTADIPLAARYIQKGARVIGPTGRIFTPEGIGDALATRNLMSQLREAGAVTGGPPAFEKRDRSRFLEGLDRLIQSIKRNQ